MFKYVIIAAVLPALIFGLHVLPCETGRRPFSMLIENCYELPCHVSAGDLINYQVQWVAHTGSSTLNHRIIAKAEGVTVELPVPVKNLCEKLLFGECPTVNNRSYDAGGVINVQTSLQGGVPVELNYIIENDDGNEENFVCARIDVIVN